MTMKNKNIEMEKDIHPIQCIRCNGTEFDKRISGPAGYYHNIYYYNYVCNNSKCNMMLNGWGIKWERNVK